jgi:hypothetical protein
MRLKQSISFLVPRFLMNLTVLLFVWDQLHYPHSSYIVVISKRLLIPKITFR